MNKKYTFSNFFILVLCFICLIPINTHAKFIEQIPIHTKALSLANNVTAYPPGILSIHYNPAGLSQLSFGKTVSFGLNSSRIERNDKFSPNNEFYLLANNQKYNSEYDPASDAKNSRNDRRIYLPFSGQPLDLPLTLSPLPIGMSYRKKNSDWTFAYGLYTPYSWGYNNDSDDAARFQGKASFQQHLIYFSPSFSYQVNKDLSLGFSCGLGQSSYGILTGLRMPSDQMARTLRTRHFNYNGSIYTWQPLLTPFEKIADLDIKMKDHFSPSFNFGLLYQALDTLTVGLTYHSPTFRKLKGKYDIEYTKDFIGLVGIIQGNSENIFEEQIEQMRNNGEDGSVILNNYDYPQNVHIGFKYQPIEQLKFLVDLHWTNWSVIDQQKIEFDNEVQIIKLYNILEHYQNANNFPNNSILIQKNFSDTIDWGLGVEYQVREYLALRLGYERRSSGIDDNYFDLYSFPETNLIGAGFEMKLKNQVTFELGIGFLFCNDYEIPAEIDKTNSSNSTLINQNSLLVSTGSQNLNSNKTSLTSPYPGLNYELDLTAYFFSFNITMPYEKFTDDVKDIGKSLAKYMPF